MWEGWPQLFFPDNAFDGGGGIQASRLARLQLPFPTLPALGTGLSLPSNSLLLSPGSPNETFRGTTFILDGRISGWVEQELCLSNHPGPHHIPVGTSCQGSDILFQLGQARLGGYVMMGHLSRSPITIYKHLCCLGSPQSTWVP